MTDLSRFPRCRACLVVLPPAIRQGPARVWCGETCRRWAHRHPGQTRDAGVACSVPALEVWATWEWDPVVQPWGWPGLGVQQRAREVLAGINDEKDGA
ncbi:hypothetical protein GCM10028777_24950 [Angustibacter speluncae]